ncbi:hypothetical protein [Nocardioides sp. Soil796]|uniref:hypothetical protein n=1 Tax=Nocardioides sp. Soil796 TaxID=1736412 RepID=UPI0012E3F84A|nr:hypothetical protein [Nocardioides sp. Soil796]
MTLDEIVRRASDVEADSTESQANLDGTLMLASIESCDCCDMFAVATPAACQRWIVEHVHDPDCPKE